MITSRELDSSDAAAVSGVAPQKIVVPDTAAGEDHDKNKKCSPQEKMKIRQSSKKHLSKTI